MAKRKNEFHELKFINPFDNKYFNSMVYKDWANREIFNKWRKDNSKWLKDPKLIDLLDVDELLTQWNVDPRKRKINPSTCNMIFKELAIVLRMVDAEHQDIILSNSDNVPGVIYSNNLNKWIYLDYNLDETNTKNATKVKSYNSEEEAYYYYRQNRESMIEQVAAKALSYGLIDPEVYDKYLDQINIRDYSYYKNKLYLEQEEST